MASSTDHPQTNDALVLSTLVSPPDLEVKSLPFPKATSGSAVIEILSSPVLSYTMEVVSGRMPYPLSLPMTIGGGAVARIVEIGADATSLKSGDLVLSQVSIYGRDDPNNQILIGLHGGANPESSKLMNDEWRHGVYARYAKVPLENLTILNESILHRDLGYSYHDLSYILRLLVPAGGLSDILDVKAGDTVIIAPASGQFGGGAVELAHALGADVVACARNIDALDSLKSTVISRSAPGTSGARITTVKLTGDVPKDAENISTASGGKADKYLDFSPPQAAGSTHFSACLMALKKGGQACFMGGVFEPVSIPYGLIMFNELRIGGKFMYTRQTIARVIKLVESGRIALGEKRGGLKIASEKGFALHEWRDAFELAAKESGWGVQVVLEPGKR